MFSIDLSPVKEFKKFFELLPGLLKFAARLTLALIPILAYILYPELVKKYEYFSATFFAWIFAGFAYVGITMLFYSTGDKFRKDNDLALIFHNLILIVFWIISFFFFSVTDSTYNHGGQLKLEQAGRCDLVHENEKGICLARQHLLIEKNGIFKVISGNVLGDKTCVSTLQERLPSGMLRNNTLHADANFCEKLKVGDGVKLSSHLIKRDDTCNGFLTRDEFILITESLKQMRIDVCTTYELIPS